MIVAVFKIIDKISYLVIISFINMKGKGKSKSKRKTISARKTNDQSLGSSLELVNTHTDTDKLDVETDYLSAASKAH